MAGLGRAVTFGSEDKAFEVKELPEPWLSLRVGVVAAHRTEKAYIWHPSPLRGANKFFGDVKLVLMRWRDQTDRITASVFEGLGHNTFAAGSVRYDLYTERLDLLCPCRLWM